MISFGIRAEGVYLWNTFYLSALKCSTCCCVASWPVYQRPSWRVAHRQHHHCSATVWLFPCFWRGFSGWCCKVRGSIKHLQRSHNCQCVWNIHYSSSLTFSPHPTRVLVTCLELRNSQSTFYRTVKTHFILCFECSRGWKAQELLFSFFAGNIWTNKKKWQNVPFLP